MAVAMTAGVVTACAKVEAKPPSAPASQEGAPYQLKDTQVWTVPDTASGRAYQVFVGLPPSYATSPQRRYPVLYVTDADYAFPLIRSVTRRINGDGPVTEEFILVGLSYAVGDDPVASRRRDYTPTPRGPRSAPPETVHGGGAAYQAYLRDQVLPFVEQKFRADPARRVFAGHSYGSLLGAQILFSEPTLFQGGYILGSPSLWFDDKHMLAAEARFAGTHRDLPAKVFAYIGAYEAARPGDRRYHQENDMVRDLATFEARLKSRNYPGFSMSSTVIPDENHLTVFPAGLTRGLLAMLPAEGG